MLRWLDRHLRLVWVHLISSRRICILGRTYPKRVDLTDEDLSVRRRRWGDGCKLMKNQCAKCTWLFQLSLRREYVPLRESRTSPSFVECPWPIPWSQARTYKRRRWSSMATLIWLIDRWFPWRYPSHLRSKSRWAVVFSLLQQFERRRLICYKHSFASGEIDGHQNSKCSIKMRSQSLEGQALFDWDSEREAGYPRLCIDWLSIQRTEEGRSLPSSFEDVIFRWVFLRDP